MTKDGEFRRSAGSASRNKLENGPVRRGQLWRKVDSGRLMQVKDRMRDNCWTCLFVDRVNSGRSHQLKEMDIYKYYERVR